MQQELVHQLGGNTASDEIAYSCISRTAIDWPLTCCRFGPHSNSHRQYTSFQLFLAYRTDSEYSKTQRSWNRVGSSVMIGHVQMPEEGKTFLEESLGFYGVDIDRAKGRACGSSGEPEFTHLIVHENEVNRIEVCERDPKFIATSGSSNRVYIWNVLKHKANIKSYQSKDRLAAHASDLQ
jgi:hypothetical protein